jgi:hypothetical protein
MLHEEKEDKKNNNRLEREKGDVDYEEKEEGKENNKKGKETEVIRGD